LRIAVGRLEWFQTLGRLLCYVDFSLCANRNRIPNDPVALDTRRRLEVCGGKPIVRIRQRALARRPVAVQSLTLSPLGLYYDALKVAGANNGEPVNLSEDVQRVEAYAGRAR